MSIWPYLPVWPFLLLGAAICSLWNWRAAISFAACILAVKAIQYVRLEPQQLFFFALYSFVGALVFFAWDKHAGVVLCLVGLIYFFHLIGIVPHWPKIVAVEIVLFLGMAGCAYDGGSGGILASSPDPDSNRPVHLSGVWLANSNPSYKMPSATYRDGQERIAEVRANE